MELLLPVGSVEALYAAVEGGADALYLGMDRFNARGRAKNFSKEQFVLALSYAHAHKVKVYLTLNTLIKNNELYELFDLLTFIAQTDIDAMIVQDWGVYWICKNFFPEIVLHASTQMGIHNSCGSQMALRYGFSRIVTARELTISEIEAVCKASNVEVEVFVHGALCYSFSGSCLFSSWVGGMSANRGLCRQPCRRVFSRQENMQTGTIFSMSDLQLVKYLPILEKIGVSSLKIEGRMKPAEYVYRVAKAYRIAVDTPERLEEAEKILEFDYARDKSEYFFGHNLKDSISSQSFVGKPAGMVSAVSNDYIEVKIIETIHVGDRIRIQPACGVDSLPLKVEEIETVHENVIRIKTKTGIDQKLLSVNDNIYIVGTSKTRFPSRLKEKAVYRRIKKITRKEIDTIAENIYSYKKTSLQHDEIIIRIDSINWLAKIDSEYVDAIIFDMSMNDLEQIDFTRPVITKSIEKIIISLPMLVFENNLKRLKKIVNKFYLAGFSTFMIQQLWQLPILDGLKDIGIWASENVYTMNDAAIAMLKSQKIERYILPLEGDLQNLESYQYKDGIVPLYYHPKVFTSRMPVLKNQEECRDSTGTYQYKITDGIGELFPTIPVSLFHKRTELMKTGYKSFLIDFSSEKPSSNGFQRILKAYYKQIPIQPCSIFNYKNGLH